MFDANKRYRITYVSGAQFHLNFNYKIHKKILYNLPGFIFLAKTHTHKEKIEKQKLLGIFEMNRDEKKEKK